MQRWFTTAAVLCSCLGVRAEEESKKNADLSDAKVIVQRTVEALKKVQTVSY